MKDITIIIPVIGGDKTGEYVEAAMGSVRALRGNEGPVMLVGPKDVLAGLEYDDVVKVENDGDTDFSSQINLAVSKCTTKYFTVLEMDDVFTPNWFESFSEYERVNQDVSVFIPLNEAMDFRHSDMGPIGYINEPAWASSFSDEIGFLDVECLKNYMNFNLTGSVINRKDFESVGKLKTSMKLVFWYEFAMRMLNNEKKIYVVPKVGYRHLLNRPDSLSDTYNRTMGQEEAEWWIDLAQKEYLYKKDRKRTYEE